MQYEETRLTNLRIMKMCEIWNRSILAWWNMYAYMSYMNNNRTKMSSNFHSKKIPVLEGQRVDKSGVDSWINAAQTIFLLIFCLRMAILTFLWYLGFYQPFKKDGYRKWAINKLQSLEIRERILLQELCSWPYPYPSYLCYSNPSYLCYSTMSLIDIFKQRWLRIHVKLSILIEREDDSQIRKSETIDNASVPSSK